MITNSPISPKNTDYANNNTYSSKNSPLDKILSYGKRALYTGTNLAASAVLAWTLFAATPVFAEEKADSAKAETTLIANRFMPKILKDMAKSIATSGGFPASRVVRRSQRKSSKAKVR